MALAAQNAKKYKAGQTKKEQEETTSSAPKIIQSVDILNQHSSNKEYGEKQKVNENTGTTSKPKTVTNKSTAVTTPKQNTTKQTSNTTDNNTDTNTVAEIVPEGIEAANKNTISEALQNYINQANSYPGYTPKTDAEIKERATDEYNSYYNQLRQAAQQQQERSDLALQQQLEGLDYAYDKQRKATREEYNNAYSKTDRQLLSRGMQRSSYGAQTLANLANKGAEAINDIWDQQSSAAGNIEAQRTQLAQQLAQQLATYDASEAKDIMSRIRELEDQEYNRGLTAWNTQNALSAQIYQFLNQEAQQNISQEQWEKQFNESVRQYDQQHPAKSSSSYTYTSNKNNNQTGNSTGSTNGTQGMTAEQFMSLLGSATKGIAAQKVGTPGLTITTNKTNDKIKK